MLLVKLAEREQLTAPIAHLDPELVRAHGLAPLAHIHGLAGFKPSYLATALAADVRADALTEALGQLSTSSVPVMLLKGIAYVQELYADPAERPMSDIDLLVPAKRHSAAVAALTRIGYVHHDLGERSFAHHAVTLVRRDNTIDLHRSMIQPLRGGIDMRAIWSRARSIEGLDACRPELVDEALLHLSHVGRHEMNVAAINYLDGARLLARLEVEGRTHELASLARTYRISRLVGAARDMTTSLTRGDGRLTASAAWRAILPTPREILEAVQPSRPRQILRKIALTEGPREFAGLMATFVLDQAERLRANRLSR